MSFKKGYIPWNKGKTGIKTSNKGMKSWNKGLKMPQELKLKLSLAKLGKPRPGNPENWKHTEETKRKISLNGKGKIRSQEFKNKVSAFMKGRIPYNKGKIGIFHHSEEVKKIISLKNKGKIRSEEMRKKISIAQKGKPKIKVSIALRGNIPWNKGKKTGIIPIGSFKKGHIPWNSGLKGIHLRREWTQEQRDKARLANLGKKHSDETKKKIGLTSKGRPAWNKGKKLHFEVWNKGKKGLQKCPWKGKKLLWESGMKGRKHSEKAKQKLRLKRLNQIIPNKDTSIEIKLQNFLREQNIEFETHYPILGQPDVFIKPNICIFADGCYWHKCVNCGFIGERKRDEYVTKTLQSQGYKVIRIWEHEINALNFSIRDLISSNESKN